MAFCLLRNAKISGISAVIPAKEFSLTDESNLYNGDRRRIDRVIKSSGFLKRRIADKDVLASDLCVQAAETLLSKMNVSSKAIEALVFVSYTPDYLMPATAYILHQRLGLSELCLAMDIPQACSGYVFGLYQAAMLLNANCRKVLLLVGDCFSKFSDMFRDNTAPIFGDAGTATLLQYDEKAAPMYFNFHTYSGDYDALICRNGGFRNPPVPEDFYPDGSYKYDAYMDGGRIFAFTVQNVPPTIIELLKFAKKNTTDINTFIMHQANRFILSNIAQQIDIDFSEVPADTLTNYGNQCGASIPCTIMDKLSHILRNEKKCLFLSGFGVGLSIANAIVTMEKIYCSGLQTYKKTVEKKGEFYV